MANVKKDGIPYPADPRELLQDKVLGAAFRDYGKKALITENIKFLDALSSGRKDYQKIYKKFISTKGSLTINIPSDMRKTCIDLFEADNWDKTLWKKAVDEIAADFISNQLAQNNLDAFYKSDFFMPFHRANLRKKVKKVSKGQLDELGVDKKHQSDVMDLAALMVADKKAGERAAAVMVSKKRTSIKEKKSFLAKMKKVFKVK